MAAITLTVVAGPAAGATISASFASDPAAASKPIKVGRIRTGNSLVVKDEAVSSKHLQISWRDGAFFALDLRSSNGTKLNDSRSSMMDDQEYKLRDGDELHLGPKTVLRVQIQAADAGAGEQTVEQRLTADAERLAASIQAAAAAAQQQIRQEWAEQRAALQAVAMRT